MTRRATARSVCVAGSCPAVKRWAAGSTATGDPLVTPERLARIATPTLKSPFPTLARSVREDVLLRPAFKIKQHAMRQEIEALAGQPVASLAGQYSIESPAQRVQMKHVRGGITQL